jgi:F-type H+-transporting ATPase subunit epsilon
MSTFLLEIITPERLAFSEEVNAIYAPTPDGTIGILAHHMPLFTALSEGEVKIISVNKEYFLAVGGGFMEVGGNKVSVLVSRAVHAHEINEAEIVKAKQTALDAIKRQVKGAELESAQAILRRSLLEFKILRRHQHKNFSSS